MKSLPICVVTLASLAQYSSLAKLAVLAPDSTFCLAIVSVTVAALIAPIALTSSITPSPSAIPASVNIFFSLALPASDSTTSFILLITLLATGYLLFVLVIPNLLNILCTNFVLFLSYVSTASFASPSIIALANSLPLIVDESTTLPLASFALPVSATSMS